MISPSFNNLNDILAYLATIQRIIGHSYNRFEPISVGSFNVYVFAGPNFPGSAYPEDLLDRITMYERVSVGVWESTTDPYYDHERVVRFEQDRRFQKCDWISSFIGMKGEFLSIAPWVPIEVLCQIVRDVHKVSVNRVLW